MKKSVLSLLICLLLHQTIRADLGHFVGASGVARHGDALLIVSDKDPGAYYRYPIGKEHGPRIPIDLSQLQRVPMPAACLATDLEGIEVLADHRVVVVSEGLSALVDEKGLVAQYGGPFSELAGIGLEGVDSRPIENGASKVAVCWEGGYTQLEKVPTQLIGKVARTALKPVVLVHDIQENQVSGKIKLNDADTIELNVPVPNGSEPFAQRFRAPDLVWHKLKRFDHEEWGFIVLLSSQNSMENKQFLYYMLQRFDNKGQPFGEPIDINKFLPSEMHGVNWEGLDWFERGKSLVLIFDSLDETPAAYVVDLPEDWKWQN
jgi:hypothetical protein